MHVCRGDTLHLHGTAAVDELKSRGREASDSKVPPFPAGCILLADAPSKDGYLGRAPPRLLAGGMRGAYMPGMENHAAPLFTLDILVRIGSKRVPDYRMIEGPPPGDLSLLV
ncbi:hypothetical protein PUN28_019134 [Cardiocondyla obscurior]|uniref:Uncharacterized protein n=1 Tax=Cardiocondyla obscurior TaxID=286306 RepID=A0AAW2EDJ8_9HYME